jgi:hypothetical protein
VAKGQSVFVKLTHFLDSLLLRRRKVVFTAIKVPSHDMLFLALQMSFIVTLRVDTVVRSLGSLVLANGKLSFWRSYLYLLVLPVA